MSARGLPSEALAKGGGKAERVGLQNSGSCSWLALLRFFRGVASRPAVSYPVPMGPTPLPTAPEAWGSDTLTPTHRPGSRSTARASVMPSEAPPQTEMKTSELDDLECGSGQVENVFARPAGCSYHFGSPSLKFSEWRLVLLEAQEAPFAGLSQTCRTWRQPNRYRSKSVPAPILTLFKNQLPNRPEQQPSSNEDENEECR